MRVRNIVIVGMLVALVGVVSYLHFSRPGDDTTSAIPTAPTTTAPSTTTTVVPTEIRIAEPPDAAAENAARAGLTVAFTWYPATDATQNDAYGRARKWLTSTFADRMIIDARTERGPGVQWDEWAQQHAKVVADVSIECSGCPEDTANVVRRVATIKQTAISGGSTDMVNRDTTVWVTLVREGDRWLIDDVRY